MALAPAVGNQVRLFQLINGNGSFQSAWIEAFTSDTVNTLSWARLGNGMIGHPSRQDEPGATYVSLSNVPRLGTAQRWSVIGAPDVGAGGTGGY